MSDYVKFLVRDLDPGLLKDLRLSAKRRKVSLAEQMRTILCRHFELDCRPSRARPRRKSGATTIVLNLPPALWQAIKDESAETGVSMQLVVKEALAAPYRERRAA